MIIRQIKEEDFPEVLSWFSARKWPQPPVESIAPSIGLVAEKDGAMLACAWAYFTGRSIAFIEWTGTNPKIPDEDGTRALHYVIEGMKDFCGSAEPPIKALCFYTQNDKLASHFEKMKFKKNDKYIRLIWTNK